MTEEEYTAGLLAREAVIAHTFHQVEKKVANLKEQLTELRGYIADRHGIVQPMSGGNGK